MHWLSCLIRNLDCSKSSLNSSAVLQPIAKDHFCQSVRPTIHVIQNFSSYERLWDLHKTLLKNHWNGGCFCFKHCIVFGIQLEVIKNLNLSAGIPLQIVVYFPSNKNCYLCMTLCTFNITLKIPPILFCSPSNLKHQV